MEHKLEITWKLELMNELDQLDNQLVLLNLPTIRECNRRCKDCITEDIGGDPTKRLSAPQIREFIDYFTKHYNIKFLTINGRGDPFHPKLKQETFDKIRYASSKGVQSYIFTSGDNLDRITCQTLADNKTNIIISLLGNPFLDDDFFKGKEYKNNFAKTTAANLRRLIRIYAESSSELKDGLTRIGMNYVVSEDDLTNRQRLYALKQAANNNGIFFHCNTTVKRYDDDNVQRELEQLALNCSDFGLINTTTVGGFCRMGAASSVTVDYDGTLLKCPYLHNTQGRGRITEMSEDEINVVITGFLQETEYPCVLRTHQKL